jgi:hypothetical protein
MQLFGSAVEASAHFADPKRRVPISTDQDKPCTKHHFHTGEKASILLAQCGNYWPSGLQYLTAIC